MITPPTSAVHVLIDVVEINLRSRLGWANYNTDVVGLLTCGPTTLSIKVNNEANLLLDLAARPVCTISTCSMHEDVRHTKQACCRRKANPVVLQELSGRVDLIPTQS